LQHENEGLRLEKIYSWNDIPSTLLSKLVRSGHGDRTAAGFLFYAVGNLDMNQARREVELFAKTRRTSPSGPASFSLMLQQESKLFKT
jgi:hypothetical protein